MAASIDTYVKQPNKYLIRQVTVRNILMIAILSVVHVLGIYSGRQLDVASQTLTACKWFILVVGLAEILTWCILIQRNKIQIYSLFNSCLILFLGTAVFHIIAVLYGAPVIESTAETYHFSMLLTVVTVLPSCCVLGPPSSSWTSWIRVYALNMPELGMESTVQITSVCSMFGAWLGAFPIPLDWDRPWQVWPVSCVIGTLGGYCVGLVLSASHLLYKTRQRKSKLF